MGWKIDKELKEKCYADIKDILAVKVKNIRNILTAVQGQYFDIVWKDGTQDDRIKLLELVERGDKDTLTKYLLQHKLIGSAAKPYKYLLEVCRKHHITNYGRMSRSELITMVEKLEEKQYGQDQQAAVQEDERPIGGDVSNNERTGSSDTDPCEERNNQL